MSVAPKPSKWPRSTGRDGERAGGGEPPAPLRLSVTRGRLGLEIYEPFNLGPLRIEHLAQSFLGLKFPLDLSGGVPVFRHRRGNLERVLITTDLERVRRWAEPRVRSVWGPLARPVDLWWHDSGIGVGIVGETSAIAWDLHWVPMMGDARLVIDNARGWGLTGPALAEVLRLMDAIAGKLFQLQGRVLSVRDAGRHIGRALLPSIGARAPTATEVVFSRLRVEESSGFVELDSSYVQAELGAAASRAIELSEIARAGDEALLKGELEEARNHYLLALESAPRQRQLVLPIAEIDLAFGRVESALGLITEAMPILTSSLVGAKALLLRGEKAGARELLAQAAGEERYSPLAALVQLARADSEEDGVERRATLDAAVAAAPSLTIARWARLQARADFGDAMGAMSDAQHLEASCSGRQARFSACQRAAGIMLAAGWERQASMLYQRALRYAPDDVDAMIGLARALDGLGEGLRAIPLLERAIHVGGESGTPRGAALVELAKLVAAKLNDLPQAVARLRAVPSTDSAAVAARGLEGRFRLMLGDIVGASLAFGKMRELIEVLPVNANWAEWLLEAARFERDVMREHAAAERHLALALRIAPHNATVKEIYREVAAVLAVRHQRQRLSGQEQALSSVEQYEGDPGDVPRPGNG